MPNKKNLKESAYGRDLDSRQDVMWSHPELTKWWVAGNADMIDELCDDTVPLQKRRDRLAKLRDASAKMYEDKPYKPFEGIDWKDKSEVPYAKLVKYEAKGCPEEPDTPTNVYITVPTEEGYEKKPVLYYVMGGALFTHDIRIFPEALRWAKKFNCIVVAADYRTPLDAKYPAQINDLHAGYQWIAEHADEFNMDADNVTIFGESSGAHLALSLAFRLKRYGYQPRGVVANDPMIDDRNFYESNKIIKDPCDATRAHIMFATYVGWENCGTNYLGPEAFANHASVEECRGLCPIVINVGESDQDRDACLEFAQKLYAAKVPTSLHVWEGAAHATLYYSKPVNKKGVVNNMAKRFWDNLYGDIECFMKYDMRRTPTWFEKAEEVQRAEAEERNANDAKIRAKQEENEAKLFGGSVSAPQAASTAEDPVLAAVRDAVAQAYEIDIAEVGEDLEFAALKNNSSSRVLKVAMFIGENLDLDEDLEFEDLADLATVADVVSMLKERLG